MSTQFKNVFVFLSFLCVIDGVYSVEKQIKHRFTPEEDVIIIQEVEEYWNEIAKRVPGTTGRQCRERWNILCLFEKSWSKEEDAHLIEIRQELGPKWRIITISSPKRSKNCVKNRYNSIMRKQKKQTERSLVLVNDEPANPPLIDDTESSRESLVLVNDEPANSPLIGDTESSLESAYHNTFPERRELDSLETRTPPSFSFSVEERFDSWNWALEEGEEDLSSI
ncbi:MAG: hypothetical protein LBS83_00280 [Holosporales bacterium]|nr:hypothetical protein [Holosporales bacterium]